MNVQTVIAFKPPPGSGQGWLADRKQHERCLAASKQVQEFNKTSRASWHGWITITGPALIDCETTAKQRKLERGGRYETHMSVLLKLYRLDDEHFDHTARADLIHIMKNLQAVSEWRIRQPNPEILNNPTTVWRNFCNRASAAHDKNAKGKLNDIAALTETIKILQQRINDLEFELAEPERIYRMTTHEDEILRQAKLINKKRYELRNAEQIKKLKQIAQGNGPLATDKKYPVIYADPAWAYYYNTVTLSRSVDRHYPTMSVEEIAALPVPDIATDDAVLFLWVTSAQLPVAFQIIEAWGFEYKSSMVWVKNKTGLGFYARNQHELLLIATRGEMRVPLPKNRPASVVFSPRGKHSEKPVKFYKILEEMYPDLPKIELFARKKYPGWASWGNQCTEKHSVLRFSA
jgi:N6-adenosine-specific RNA methylase IME4